MGNFAAHAEFGACLRNERPVLSQLRARLQDWRDRHMHAQRNDRRGNLTLAIVAAFLALVGQAIILFDDFGAGSNSQGKVAAVSKAGAIWPEPAPGRITR
jgi:hypothetical protein